MSERSCKNCGDYDSVLADSPMIPDWVVCWRKRKVWANDKTEELQGCWRPEGTILVEEERPV